uniref:Uncharacterized protein n=1 Tax=Romanomermis culicivorax TaxID=13658 RepID=A0A915KTL8_ROMCU
MMETIILDYFVQMCNEHYQASFKFHGTTTATTTVTNQISVHLTCKPSYSRKGFLTILNSMDAVILHEKLSRNYGRPSHQSMSGSRCTCKKLIATREGLLQKRFLEDRLRNTRSTMILQSILKNFGLLKCQETQKYRCRSSSIMIALKN